MLIKDKRRLVQLCAIEAVSKRSAEVTNTEIRKEIGLPSGNGYAFFNQCLYTLVNEDFITRDKVTFVASHYKLTAKAKKFIKANISALPTLDPQELFPYREPNTGGGTKHAAPEPVMSRTQDLAITGIAQLIEENKQMRGLLNRYHAELGRFLNETAKEED